jgi:predicted amidophosphoribosyltransferase
MWQTLQPVIVQADILSFVPVTRARLASRGHNQARELALAIAGFSGQPVAGLLRMTRAVADMGTTKTRHRSRNVEGAFGLRNRSDALRRRINGSRIALIDDVITSGATANECAKVLLAAGAVSVDALTLARTP